MKIMILITLILNILSFNIFNTVSLLLLFLIKNNKIHNEAKTIVAINTFVLSTTLTVCESIILGCTG